MGVLFAVVNGMICCKSFVAIVDLLVVESFIFSGVAVEQHEPNKCKGYADQRRILVTELQHLTAAIGTECIAQIKRHLNAGCSEHLSSGGDMNNGYLLRAGDAKEAEGTQCHQRCSQPGIWGEKEDQQQNETQQPLSCCGDDTGRKTVR